VPALLKLGDEVESALGSMRDALTAQLASIGIGGAPNKRGRPAGSAKRQHALKGKKRPAKYRDPASGKTWAGVGMTPLWMKEYEAEGKTREDFATSGAATKKRRGKKAARK
jgi:DNA-binding protein H-NS